MVLQVNSPSSSHFCMISFSQSHFPVALSASLFLFLEKGVMKGKLQRTTEGTRVQWAWLFKFSVTLIGQDLWPLDCLNIFVCVCVCVPMYVCVLPILWQSQRLDTFSVLGEELLSWMECSRISFTYLGLRWPDTFFPVYINISLDIFVTNSRNYFLVVHMLHIHIVK